LALLAAGGLALAGCGTTTAAHDAAAVTQATTTAVTAAACSGEPTVTATASGTANAKPDTLLMTLGAQTESPKAGVALATDNAKVARLIATLRAAGVPASGIQTTGLSIYPNYKNGVVTTYSVENTITVTLTDLSSAGSIIDRAAAVVGNGIEFDNLEFVLADDDAPALTARAAAVQAAQARAQGMATAAGVTLGPLCSISDDATPDEIASGNSGSFAASASSGAAAPVESGTQQVTADVTVVYAVTSSGTS
jgi:uncharacterized protein YggE